MKALRWDCDIGTGVVPEWPKGADCKSASVSFRWFESTPRHHFLICLFCGRSSVGRAPPFQGGCREFESLRPLHFLNGAIPRQLKLKNIRSRGSVVEYFLGKEGVASSILAESSTFFGIDLKNFGRFFLLSFTILLEHTLAVQSID